MSSRRRLTVTFPSLSNLLDFCKEISEKKSWFKKPAITQGTTLIFSTKDDPYWRCNIDRLVKCFGGEIHPP